MIHYHIKGLYKTTCYKTKSNFSQLFSFLINAFASFEKLIRFHWQAFIVYKNGQNFKMLIDIFCQKLIVSNVILAFSDHQKPKMSSSANHGGRHRVPPLFKISGSSPVFLICIKQYKFLNQLFLPHLVLQHIKEVFPEMCSSPIFPHKLPRSNINLKIMQASARQSKILNQK